MNHEEAVSKLNRRLPLRQRQKALFSKLREAHRSIIASFAQTGMPPKGETAETLQHLADNDLIVLDGNGRVTGEYPFTLDNTPYLLRLNCHEVHAMCALDALAVSPMFGTKVVIDSKCHVTGEPIHIVQFGRKFLEVAPAEAIHVGIRWRQGGETAAHSL